jgi:hypothetical protein
MVSGKQGRQVIICAKSRWTPCTTAFALDSILHRPVIEISRTTSFSTRAPRRLAPRDNRKKVRFNFHRRSPLTDLKKEKREKHEHQARYIPILQKLALSRILEKPGPVMGLEPLQAGLRLASGRAEEFLGLLHKQLKHTIPVSGEEAARPPSCTSESMVDMCSLLFVSRLLLPS